MAPKNITLLLNSAESTDAALRRLTKFGVEAAMVFENELGGMNTEVTKASLSDWPATPKKTRARLPLLVLKTIRSATLSKLVST